MTTQERSTKKIITPNKHEVLVYDYLTGGEMRRMNALYMEGLKAGDVMNADGNIQKAMKDVPVSVVLKAQELALEMLILSVDGGAKETAYSDAMNMREEDLEFLMSEIDQYTTAKKN